MKLTTTMLGTLDRQDVFDIVAWNLLRQNARATAFDRVKCLYRAPDGKRCAIGWLIPDDVYSKALEFFGVRDIAARLIETDYGAKFARFLYIHMPLLRDLQEMHDANLPVEWPVALRTIARRHRLNTTVITHCERQLGFVTRSQPEHVRPVAPAYLLDFPKLLAPVNTGVDHGREERKAPREVCCA
ncbi:hypothetical protein [Paraburkholderia humisilvae]|uniref:Uncharacterized protein n=1 Tax=Paraburkholderia humisilvae TaxID=627669 RepID=A0A6J5DYC6_9BURK|nr:hypothetical protein [Paraburkholderia humisilvae]CAB3758464.1 hypothetical protein LMG29542_03346 [Paraburkholderia humisilvae]